MENKFMQGKRGLILGVANERSLAWGIAQQLHAAGAELAFSYFGKFDKIAAKVQTLAASVDSKEVHPCDVADDASIQEFMETMGKKWGKIDFIVHAIAYADKDSLSDRFLNTTRENFKVSLDASTYSLIGVTRAAHPYLAENASILTLTYLGGPRVMRSYNLMGVAKAALEATVRYLAADLGQDGIRVNAISAGPVKTLSAYGIAGFKDIMKEHESAAPLRRLTTQEDVGKAAVYLLSDLSQGVTGEIHYVDGGANILGTTA